MEENKTREAIEEFHRICKNVKGPHKKTQSQEVLSVCAVIIMIIAVISFLALFLAYNWDFLPALGYGFAFFVSGLTIYVIAKICTVLIDIKDKM